MACLFISQIIKQIIDYLSFETMTKTNLDTYDNDTPFLSFIFSDIVDLNFFDKYMQENNIRDNSTFQHDIQIPSNKEVQYHDKFYQV